MHPENPTPGDEGSAATRAAQSTASLRHTIDDLFRLLVASVGDYAIFALDPYGHVLTWNPGAERFKGYKADEIIGRHFSTFYPDEARAARLPERELEIATRDGRVEDEGWRVRKDGTRFWANVVITALRNRSGELVGFGKVTRDLSERKRAELAAIEAARELGAAEERRRMAESRASELVEINARLLHQAAELERRRLEAETANRVKSDFLAAMSHELRTPLNAIGGYVDLMLAGIRGPLTDNQLSDLNRVRTSQQHLLTLINDLLNYARVETGSLAYKLERVNVEELIRVVCEMIEPQANANGLVLTVHGLDPDLWVFGDRDRIGQILLNLLSNAIKFTAIGGRIDVHAERLDDAVTITVHDTGRGIPEDQLERIFDAFVQLDSGLTRISDGVGLGLAISRDLSRAMRGDLTVSSRVGVGSTFTLRLPLSNPSGTD